MNASSLPLVRTFIGAGRLRSLTFDDAVAALMCVFVFAIPTELLIYREVSVSLPVGALTIAIGLMGVIRRNRIIAPTPGLALLAAFVLWATASILWSPFPALTQARAVNYWELLALSAVMTQYVPVGNTRTRLFKSYVAGCAWGIADVSSRYLSGIRFQGLDGRFSAANTDPNYLGLALVIGVPIACYLAFSARSLWLKGLYLAYVPGAAFAVILTGSRGAVMSAAAAAVAVCISVKGRARVICLTGLLLIGGLLVIPADTARSLSEVLPSEAGKRFTTMGAELDHGTLANRRTFWKIGLGLAALHPVRGYGAAMGDALLSSTIGRSIGLHSLPLLLTTDEGLIGCLFFYGALLVSLPYIWRWPPGRRTAVLAAAAAWVVGTCSLNWDIHKATWLLFTLFLSPKSVPPVAAHTARWARARWWNARRAVSV